MTTFGTFLRALNAATLTPRARQTIKDAARARIEAHWRAGDRAEHPLDFTDLVQQIVNNEAGQ